MLIGLSHSCIKSLERFVQIPLLNSTYDDPEIFCDKDWDFSSDIFSAGCLFYFLVTGIELKHDFSVLRQLEAEDNPLQVQVDITCKHVSP